MIISKRRIDNGDYRRDWYFDYVVGSFYRLVDNKDVKPIFLKNVRK